MTTIMRSGGLPGLILAAVFIPHLAWAAAPRINEIRIDQPGADNDEYFELFGDPGGSLDGLTYIVIGDGAGGSGVIEAVVDLTGRSLDANGFFVAAESTFTLAVANLTANLNFENSDNVTHLLVSNFSGVNGADLDTDDDGILDATPWTAVIDSVALIESVGSGDLIYSDTTVGPDGSFVPGHVFRRPDGSGAFQIGAFSPVGGDDTPGRSNDGGPPPKPDFVAIYDIQGAGHRSAFAGAAVTTVGTVTAVDSNGFFLQDAVGDGDTDTSDGIFVFTGSRPTVVPGDAAEVVATVEERQFPPDLSTTQLTAVASVTVLGTGNTLPAPVIIGAAGRRPPTEIIDDDNFSLFDPAADGIDFYETLEGMRVTVADAVAVSPTNRFREIWVLADSGAFATRVNVRGGITIAPDDFNPERIQIQADSTLTPGGAPAVNTGDSLGDVTGVVGYSFGNYEVLATEFLAPLGGGLEPEITGLAKQPGRLSIASFNVLNLDPNDFDGDADIADGRFDAVARRIVENLGAPDIVALQEIQDNSGVIDDGTVDADLTYQTLVDAIFAAGGPLYDFFDVAPVNNQDGGQPGANIRVGYLYNPDTVAVDVFSIARLLDPDLSDGDAFFETRKPLAATFHFDGRVLHVVNNHFSSKGGSSPLFGEIQPPVNGREELRSAQAQVVNDFVDAILAADGQAHIVVLGDLNEFDFFPPLDVLKGGAAPVLSGLADGLDDLDRYSFIFDGNAQQLDHILVSDSLAGSEFDIVHANTEFAGQASDHDPLVARLFAQRVAFDLKPGSLNNCVNNNGRGVIPAAILGSDGSGGFAALDAATVDAASLRLEGLSVALRGQGRLLAHLEDLNRDGLADLVLQFADRAGAFAAGTARLTGRLLDGTPIEGSDRVCLVPRAKSGATVAIK